MPKETITAALTHVGTPDGDQYQRTAVLVRWGRRNLVQVGVATDRDGVDGVTQWTDGLFAEQVGDLIKALKRAQRQALSRSDVTG